MIEQLDQLIADLERDIEIRTTRLSLARQLRAAYDEELTPTEREAVDEALATGQAEARRKRDRERKRKSRSKPKKVGSACPDCGEIFDVPQKLGAHRRHKRPGSAAKPVEPAPTPKRDRDREAVAAVAAKVLPADDAKRYFVCITCDARADTREALAQHTDAQHHRGLKGEEHFAKAAVA